MVDLIERANKSDKIPYIFDPIYKCELDDISELKTILTPVILTLLKEKYDNVYDSDGKIDNKKISVKIFDELFLKYGSFYIESFYNTGDEHWGATRWRYIFMYELENRYKQIYGPFHNVYRGSISRTSFLRKTGQRAKIIPLRHTVYMSKYISEYISDDISDNLRNKLLLLNIGIAMICFYLLLKK